MLVTYQLGANYKSSKYDTDVCLIYNYIIYEMITTSLVASLYMVKGHYVRKYMQCYIIVKCFRVA